MVAFLAVAAFTPALAYFAHDAVLDTGEKASSTINDSLSVIGNSRQAYTSARDIVENMESIREYQENGQRQKALNETRKLEANYLQLVESSRKLRSQLNSTNLSVRLQEDLDELEDSRDSLESTVRYIILFSNTGTTVSNVQIENSQEDVRRIASVTGNINAIVVEEQSRELRTLNVHLGELSSRILKMSGLVILLAAGFAGLISIVLSRPIKQLSEEAEKIKKENLDEVDLSRVHDHTEEVANFKDVLGNMVLALKAEFNRERPEMNQLALKAVDVLSEEVPRATAESSVVSSCRKLDIDPMELGEENVDELAKQLKISMGGLQVDAETFNRIKELQN